MRYAIVILAMLGIGATVGNIGLPGVGPGPNMAGTGGGVSGQPVFDWNPGGATVGVDALEPTITINGTSVTPSFRYKGGDCDATDCDAWTYGDALPRVAVATVPAYNDGSPFMGSNDDSVRFQNSDYYQAAAATTGDITTGDIILEIVWKHTVDGADMLISKRETAGDADGWSLLLRSDAKLAFTQVSGGAGTELQTAALAGEAWNHAMFCLNRDEASVAGMAAYVNGVESGTSKDGSAGAASGTSTAKLTLGADTAGSSASVANIAYVALWEQDGWFSAGATGETQCQNLARERSYRLAGVWPQKTKGTAMPVIMGRGLFGYMRKKEGSVLKLYALGANMMRLEQPLLSDTTKGVPVEEDYVNILLQSRDLTTSWSLIDAGDTIDTAGNGSPAHNDDGGDGLIADATDGEHGVTQAVTLAATTYVFSVYAKAGDQTHAYLENSTVATADGYFNLSDCSLGTIGAAATGYVEDLGGWCRIGIGFTGTVAAHTMQMQSAAADTDNTFAGDAATINTIFWGAQVEATSAAWTSVIPTTTGSVTRTSGDQIRFNGDVYTGHTIGSATATVWDEDCVASTLHLMNAATGGASTNSMQMLTQGASQGCVLSHINGGVTTITDVNAVDVSDGAWHSCSARWKADYGEISTDGTWTGSPDVSATVSTATADAVYMGSAWTGTGQCNCNIGRVTQYGSFGGASP